jgi:N-acetylglutamate synthase-like GNAT family acetyltransferase
MNNYHLRYATADDKSWLYDLYCKTMRPCIETTWGWDDVFQMNEFTHNLSPTAWQIISDDQHDLGGFVLKEESDHFWLEMIIIDTIYQQNGIGRTILTSIQELAVEKQLPIRLNIIKTNPVVPFYQKLDFQQYDEDDYFYKFEWYCQ